MIGKWIGAGLLVMGCFLYGYFLALEIRKRREELQYLGQLLIFLKSEITYKRASLEDACQHMARQARAPYEECFLTMNKQMKLEGQTFEDTWKAALKAMVQKTWLKEEDVHCIEEIALFGGVWDITLLIGLLDRSMEEVARQIEYLDQEYEKKGKTYLYLGGCTGIGLVILLV
ncbi:MAG TPA: stage III sporulation protein AB [Lachnospiraceae bacterium]|nr:stage III sporulation protein AB [Lachnospiraceae bacterium]